MPQDVVTLSRTILRAAHVGMPRFEFLRALSRTLIGISRCDELEIQLFHPAFSFRWRAAAGPEERFGYESTAGRPENALDRLAKSVARGEFDAASPCLTKHGSFWTGNLPESLAGLGARALSRDAARDSIRSLLLVPFTAKENDYGVLAFASRQGDFFSPDSIELYEAVTQTVGLAIADLTAQASLRERVKELTCLYRISQIKAEADQAVERRLQGIVDSLPGAWQYPENAVASIELDGVTYSTGSFAGVRFRQSAPIRLAGVVRGRVEVGYVGDRPEFVAGPFLPEEQSLIEAVARELSLFVERNELRRHREQLEDRLRHADRLAIIGKVAAGVAHEINEPLGSVLGFAQLLKNAAHLPEDQQRDLDKIITAALHAREIVRKLVLFARQEPIRLSPADLNGIVRESLSMLEAQMTRAGVRVVPQLAERLPAFAGDSVQLRQVVLNLVMNAVQAMPGGGPLTIATAHEDGAVALIVEDAGIGMNESTMQEMFTPFYTTKEVGEGTGLGLSVVHGIVTTHGGTISVASAPGKGTRILVRFPIEGRAETRKEEIPPRD